MFWRSRRRREADALLALWQARLDEVRAAKPVIVAALETRQALLRGVKASYEDPS